MNCAKPAEWGPWSPKRRQAPESGGEGEDEEAATPGGDERIHSWQTRWGPRGIKSVLRQPQTLQLEPPRASLLERRNSRISKMR
eukprot:1187076-Pyramimonas_sp.AAC.1